MTSPSPRAMEDKKACKQLCTCVLGAYLCAPRYFPTKVSGHLLSSTEPAGLSPSSWTFCDTQSKSRIQSPRRTPRRHSQTFSPILLYTACSQQRNLTGTGHELAHVSSHDETHITGSDATPSRFPYGSQPYAKHALNAGGTVPHR
jgi:hypothetical protein